MTELVSGFHRRTLPTEESDFAMGELPEQIDRIIGVYHAKGTALGEVAYWLKARAGIAHCALCDITHGSVREKSEWRRCRGQLPVTVETVHLDQRSPQLHAFTEGRTPCVVAETPAGFVMLVDPDGLKACGGSPVRLVEAINTEVEAQKLRLT